MKNHKPEKVLYHRKCKGSRRIIVKARKNGEGVVFISCECAGKDTMLRDKKQTTEESK